MIELDEQEKKTDELYVPLVRYVRAIIAIEFCNRGGGKSYEHDADLDAILDHSLDQIQALKNDDPQAYYLRGTIEFHKANYVSALKVTAALNAFHLAEQNERRVWQINYMIGAVAERIGDIKQAMTELKKAVADGQGSPAPARRLGILYAQSGHPDD